MLRVINGEELANSREAWREVMIAAKGIISLYQIKKKVYTPVEIFKMINPLYFKNAKKKLSEK